MSVTDGYHGMTAVEVEVLCSLLVPHVASLSLYYIYVE
jgi:hypothetical protein